MLILILDYGIYFTNVCYDNFLLKALPKKAPYEKYFGKAFQEQLKVQFVTSFLPTDVYILLKRSHWAYQLQKVDRWFTFLLELSEHDEILDRGQNHYKMNK